jgi:hypothetical protein
MSILSRCQIREEHLTSYLMSDTNRAKTQTIPTYEKIGDLLNPFLQSLTGSNGRTWKGWLTGLKIENISLQSIFDGKATLKALEGYLDKDTYASLKNASFKDISFLGRSLGYINAEEMKKSLKEEIKKSLEEAVKEGKLDPKDLSQKVEEEFAANLTETCKKIEEGLIKNGLKEEKPSKTTLEKIVSIVDGIVTPFFKSITGTNGRTWKGYFSQLELEDMSMKDVIQGRAKLSFLEKEIKAKYPTIDWDLLQKSSTKDISLFGKLFGYVNSLELHNTFLKMVMQKEQEVVETSFQKILTKDLINSPRDTASLIRSFVTHSERTWYGWRKGLNTTEVSIYDIIQGKAKLSPFKTSIQTVLNLTEEEWNDLEKFYLEHTDLLSTDVGAIHDYFEKLVMKVMDKVEDPAKATFCPPPKELSAQEKKEDEALEENLSKEMGSVLGSVKELNKNFPNGISAAHDWQVQIDTRIQEVELQRPAEENNQTKPLLYPEDLLLTSLERDEIKTIRKIDQQMVVFFKQLGNVDSNTPKSLQAVKDFQLELRRVMGKIENPDSLPVAETKPRTLDPVERLLLTSLKPFISPVVISLLAYQIFKSLQRTTELGLEIPKRVGNKLATARNLWEEAQTIVMPKKGNLIETAVTVRKEFPHIQKSVAHLLQSAFNAQEESSSKIAQQLKITEKLWQDLETELPQTGISAGLMITALAIRRVGLYTITKYPNEVDLAKKTLSTLLIASYSYLQQATKYREIVGVGAREEMTRALTTGLKNILQQAIEYRECVGLGVREQMTRALTTGLKNILLQNASNEVAPYVFLLFIAIMCVAVGPLFQRLTLASQGANENGFRT